MRLGVARARVLGTRSGVAWARCVIFVCTVSVMVMTALPSGANQPPGTIMTIVGPGHSGNPGDGRPASEAYIDGLSQMAFGPDGSLYLTDPGNSRVRRVDRVTGIVTSVAGAGELRRGYDGDGGSAVDATFYNPQGLAFDAEGNLYIADSVNHVIRRVDRETGIIETIAGGGVQGYSGDGGPATGALLNLPRGMDFDAAGNLYVAESRNHVVRRIAPDGAITTVVGTGVRGYSTDGSARATMLDNPFDVAIGRDGHLYVSDLCNNRILRVDLASGTLSTFVGRVWPLSCSIDLPVSLSSLIGDEGPASEAALSLPGGIAFDESGNLFIADSHHNRIRRVDAATGTITTVAGIGLPGFTGDGGPPKEARMTNPLGVTFDPSGNLLIADGNNFRVRRVT
jgi:sugar lactone lactonase YvrE